MKFILIIIPEKSETKIEFDYFAEGEVYPDWYRWYTLNFSGSKSVYMGVFMIFVAYCCYCLCFCGIGFSICNKCKQKPKQEIVIVKKNPYDQHSWNSVNTD